jgi:hypothetical protein
MPVEAAHPVSLQRSCGPRRREGRVEMGFERHGDDLLQRAATLSRREDARFEALINEAYDQLQRSCGITPQKRVEICPSR